MLTDGAASRRHLESLENTEPARRGTVVSAAILAGVLLGFLYTLSPMTVWFVPASVAIVMWAGRSLPPRERRWIRGLLVGAILVRVFAVAALFLFGTPDYASFNVFFGDEQYMVIRSIRLRNLWLGLPLSPEAFVDVFDSYGRTSYLNVIAYAQLLVGPSPYGVHLLNTVFYLVGAIVLHRIARRAYGPVPAFGSLVFVLFLPTLVAWSASALKESLNFLVVVCTMGATIAVVRARWRWRPVAALVVVAGIAILRTFRAGAFEIAVASLALGLTARFATRRLWRIAALTAAVSVWAGPALRDPRVQGAALDGLRSAVRIHMGHVFTRGHSYRLLDDVFYVSRLVTTMNWDDAVRFVDRAAVSVLLFPVPWDLRSWSELAYLPEQLIWYIVLATAVIGFVVGLRRDALVSCVFAAYAVVALMVVGLTTGNIGTLVRHRVFALPYLIVLSAVGMAALLARLGNGAPIHAERTDVLPPALEVRGQR
jgi:hypothetical protein